MTRSLAALNTKHTGQLLIEDKESEALSLESLILELWWQKI